MISWDVKSTIIECDRIKWPCWPFVKKFKLVCDLFAFNQQKPVFIVEWILWMFFCCNQFCQVESSRRSWLILVAIRKATRSSSFLSILQSSDWSSLSILMTFSQSVFLLFIFHPLDIHPKRAFNWISLLLSDLSKISILHFQQTNHSSFFWYFFVLHFKFSIPKKLSTLFNSERTSPFRWTSTLQTKKLAERNCEICELTSTPWITGEKEKIKNQIIYFS